MSIIKNTASVKYSYLVGDKLVTKTAQATLEVDPIDIHSNIVIKSCYYRECCQYICYTVELTNIGGAVAEVELTNHADKCLRTCDNYRMLTIAAGEQITICFWYDTCRCRYGKHVKQYAKAVVNNGHQTVLSNLTCAII